MPRISAFSLFVVLGVGVGCGASAPPDLTDPGGTAGVSVQVISHNMRDVVVYMYVGQSRRRLGLAGGNETTMFKVPWSQVATANSRVQLVADQMGDQTETVSDDLQLTPGNKVVWTLEPHLDRSSIAVY